MSDKCKYCGDAVEMAEFMGGVTKLIHSGSTMSDSYTPYPHTAEVWATKEPEPKPLKNLPPAQLPIGTVIGKKAWGRYDTELFIKEEGHIWVDLFSGCGCCTDHVRIFDSGCDKNDQYDGCRATTNKTSAEYFTDFKIIAVPPGFVVDPDVLHGPWVDEYGTNKDGTPIHDCIGVNCEA